MIHLIELESLNWKRKWCFHNQSHHTTYYMGCLSLELRERVHSSEVIHKWGLCLTPGRSQHDRSRQRVWALTPAVSECRSRVGVSSVMSSSDWHSVAPRPASNPHLHSPQRPPVMRSDASWSWSSHKLTQFLQGTLTDSFLISYVKEIDQFMPWTMEYSIRVQLDTHSTGTEVI